METKALYEAVALAFERAVRIVGVNGLRATSMFASSKRSAEIKKAA